MARTEAAFREVNEAIAKTAERFESTTRTSSANAPTRTARTASPPTSTTTRTCAPTATHFIVAEGHEEPRSSGSSTSARDFAVVEKFQPTDARASCARSTRAACRV